MSDRFGIAVRGFLVVAMVCASGSTHAATYDDVQARIDADLAAGKPIVAHLVVALCDNENQGIVPVPAALGDGQTPRTNLYWGALYGVKTHFSRQGWEKVPVAKPEEEAVLERVLFRRTVRRGDEDVPVYVVADAWDGASIRSAIGRFLSMAAGRDTETLRVGEDEISVGGGAHLVAYVGHNGLMEFDAPAVAEREEGRAASSSVALACASKAYFLDSLNAGGSHPLLLTTGLMAPEAYTLDAVVRAWAGGAASADVREAAARAYDAYQKCGLTGARKLFWGAR